MRTDIVGLVASALGFSRADLADSLIYDIADDVLTEALNEIAKSSDNDRYISIIKSGCTKNLLKISLATNTGFILTELVFNYECSLLEFSHRLSYSLGFYNVEKCIKLAKALDKLSKYVIPGTKQSDGLYLDKYCNMSLYNKYFNLEYLLYDSRVDVYTQCLYTVYRYKEKIKGLLGNIKSLPLAKFKVVKVNSLILVAGNRYFDLDNSTEIFDKSLIINIDSKINLTSL